MSAIFAEGDRPRAHVAELFVHRHFFVDADAQGLVELAAGVMDVGDLAEEEWLFHAGRRPSGELGCGLGRNAARAAG
jgi:hypothetical protein